MENESLSAQIVTLKLINTKFKARIDELQALLRECEDENTQLMIAKGELEARLDAIDSALDDADAPDSTAAHALDNDPIIERIKLWRHAQEGIAESYEARLKAANRNANIVASAMRNMVKQREKAEADIDLARQYAEKAEAKAGPLRAALVKAEAYLAEVGGALYRLWDDGEILEEGKYEEWEQALAELRNFSRSTLEIGLGEEWESVTLYREILAALSPAEQAKPTPAIVKTLTNQHGQAFCVYLSDGRKIGIERDGGAAWLRIEDTPIVRAAEQADDEKGVKG